MAGSYLLVVEAVGIDGRPDKPGHLYFTPLHGVTPSAEERRFKAECEMIADALRTRVQPIANDTFRDAFDELLACAQLGLVQGQANLPEASADVADFKLRLVARAGQLVRRRYLNKLLLITTCVALGLLAIGYFAPNLIDNKLQEPAVDKSAERDRTAQTTNANPRQVEGMRKPIPHSNELPPAAYLRNYSYMLAAAMLGLWLSFAVRKSFTFEQLYLPEADLLGPVHRVIFVLISTSLLALFCYLNVAGVSFGDFSTQQIPFSKASAFLFGAISGVGEALLSDAILPHVRRVLGGLSQPKSGISIHP